jgi:hypothetical protein
MIILSTFGLRYLRVVNLVLPTRDTTMQVGFYRYPRRSMHEDHAQWGTALLLLFEPFSVTNQGT